MKKPTGLDICCGKKGASQAWHGLNVVTLDIDPIFNPDILVDVREWSWKGERPLIIWCSPPCDEFARESMPWCATGKAPDLSIWYACQRIIRESNPIYYVMENVRGAQKWVGESNINYGPFHLWTNIPLHKFEIQYKKKESYGSKQKADRAMIPHKISKIVYELATKTMPLFETI